MRFFVHDAEIVSEAAEAGVPSGGIPTHLCGIDEAGRGPLAGPVVAAAVCVHAGLLGPGEGASSGASSGVRAMFKEVFASINDSKKLTPAKRAALHAGIQNFAAQHPSLLAYAYSVQGVEVIAAKNILGATHAAMAQAQAAAAKKMCTQMHTNAGENISNIKNGVGAGRGAHIHTLVDGRAVPGQPWKNIIKGDGKSACIALASVIAKEVRDAWMLKLDAAYPAYGFAQHKGYGTKAHRAALLKHGPCPQHRALFLRKIFEKNTG